MAGVAAPCSQRPLHHACSEHVHGIQHRPGNKDSLYSIRLPSNPLLRNGFGMISKLHDLPSQRSVSGYRARVADGVRAVSTEVTSTKREESL